MNTHNNAAQSHTVYMEMIQCNLSELFEQLRSFIVASSACRDPLQASLVEVVL